MAAASLSFSWGWGPIKAAVTWTQGGELVQAGVNIFCQNSIFVGALGVHKLIFVGNVK